MEDVYSQSYEEVYEVISLMPIGMLNKIPLKFREMIENKRSKDYSINLTSIDEIENVDFKQETIIILGLIYRDFMCSPEEKKILQEQEREFERKEKEKYNPDNLFKDNRIKEVENVKEIQNEEIKALTEVKEKSFFKKVIEKIKGFFSRF